MRFNKSSIEKKNREVRKKYLENNKDSILSKSKEYKLRNSESIKIQRKEYRNKNKEKINKYRNEKMKTDPKFRLSNYLRTRIKSIIKNLGSSKSKKTEDILGCTLEYFIYHIEQLFKPGMSWQNHGDWHLDHITPISWAKTEEEVYRLNHYTNFQPLWACENLSKNNRFSG